MGIIDIGINEMIQKRGGLPGSFTLITGKEIFLGDLVREVMDSSLSEPLSQQWTKGVSSRD